LTHRRTLFWAVQRWTGHAFRDWDDARRWWEANRGRSEEQWMRDGLAFTAKRADDGDVVAQALLRVLVPDLPADDNEVPFTIPPFIASDQPPVPPGPYRVFRARWVRENEARLVFSHDTGIFLLRP
jgi:hypothetical protein